MMRYWTLLILMLTLAGAASANGPDRTNYQGLALDPSGVPINGSVDLELSVWTDRLSTSPSERLYAETHAGVQVVDGVFSVELGGGATLVGTFDAALFDGGTRWLETRIDGETLQPRTQFLSVPYAFRAKQAESIASLTGAVMHFALPACPQGWSDYSPAHGRALVGAPGNGTIGGSTGPALGDLESPVHTHSVTVSATSTGTSGTHSHFIGSRTTSTDQHNHRWIRWNGALKDWESYRSSGTRFTISDTGNGLDLAGTGVWPIAATSDSTTDIYTTNDSHNHSVSSQSSGSVSGHGHSIDSRTATSGGPSPVAHLPYLQLLTCVKD